MFRKNRTHDQGWKLAAQGHLLQVLEIYSGAPVRFEQFDTVTTERINNDHYEGRKIKISALVVGDKLGSTKALHVVSATMTLGFHKQMAGEDFWQVVGGSLYSPEFVFVLTAAGWDKPTMHRVTARYYGMHEEKESVLPEIRVQPDMTFEEERAGGYVRQVGRHLGDRVEYHIKARERA